MESLCVRRKYISQHSFYRFVWTRSVARFNETCAEDCGYEKSKQHEQLKINAEERTRGLLCSPGKA